MRYSWGASEHAMSERRNGESNEEDGHQTC